MHGENDFTPKDQIIPTDGPDSQIAEKPTNVCLRDGDECEAVKLLEEVERLRIWEWSENSDDGSNYNPALDRICKAVRLAGGCNDWLRLRQALATAMYHEFVGRHFNPEKD